VTLQADVRVTARADGTEVREERLQESLFADPRLSPDGTHRLVSKDGNTFIEPTAGGDAVTVANVDTANANVMWSPTGEQVAFDVEFDAAPEGGSSTLYVASADGSDLMDLGDGLSGDAFPLAWAPDGARIAFGLYGGDAAAPISTLYVADSEGSQRTAIGPFTHPQGDGGWDRPRFSPDGDRIAAFSPEPGLSLRVFDLAGGPPVDIEGDNVRKFSWSPDGRSLAFDRFDADSQRSTIFLGDVAGGEPRELTEGEWPRWSPAGDRVAFKRGSGNAGESRIHTIVADGSREAALGPAGNYVFQELRWSEDGSEVVFTRPAFGAAQLYRVDLAAGTAEPVGSAMGTAGNPPRSVSISPDGRHAVYLLDPFSPGGGWQLMVLSTGASTELIANGFPFGDVTWTPGGPRVALGGTSASVTEPGGSELRSLGTGTAHRVVFSPDGLKLAVLMEHTLMIASIDGPERAVLYSGESQIDIVQDVDWSPTGQRITFAVTHQDASGVASTLAYVSDLDGNATKVSSSNDYGGLPYWSPDANTLAQVRKAAGTAAYEVWAMDDDGGGARMLASFGGYCCDGLHWSPDGTRIAVSQDPGTVALIDVMRGVTMTAIATGGGCSIVIAGWSNDGVALYAYPACYFGI
jgi:Tol biopolymer transport system component